MRVLIVNPRFFIYGGAELLIVELCRYLTRKNVEHALLTTAIIPEVSQALPKTRIILIPCRWDSLKFYFNLWLAVRKHASQYDLINIHNFPAEFSAFMSRRPVVWMCNEPELYLRKINTKSRRGKLLGAPVFLFERWIVRNFIRKTIVSDPFNARRFQSLYGIAPSVVNYGIDYDFFSVPDESGVHRLKAQWGKRFVILHVGMMTPLKNQLRSLQALCEVKKRIPDCLLVLAGSWEDAYKSLLDSFIIENQLAKNVIFTGHIDRQELKSYYYTCNVLLHPIGSQGGWLAPFEALCAALPIVVAPDMTASEIITEKQLGTVTNDYEEVINCIYEQPSSYQAMAQYGKQWVRENLSWDKFCQGMLDVFNAALTDEDRPARR
jgi:glycosyltransferase involved in cell wall biosynthesis